MKKTLYLTATAAVLALAPSCSEEQTIGGGEGRVLLSTSVNADMEVVSRSLADDLGESTIIWISSERGLVRRYNGIAEVPAEPIALLSGSYVAEGWAGDSVPASWDQRWFKAYVPFTVSDNATTDVNLALKVANVAVSVRYEDGVAEVLKDCVMTVGHTGGELVYEGENAGKRGYFMMPSASRDLTYKLTASELNGRPFEHSGTIIDAKAATEYVLNVKYIPENEELGGGYFTIIVDETPIEVITEDVPIIAPPAFNGYGFELDRNITGEKGTIGPRTVYVRSATRITGLTLASEALTSVLGGPDLEYFGMQDDVKAQLEAAGIRILCTYNEAEDNTLMEIDFDAAYTDALDNGTYVFDMEATDVDGRKGRATMTIEVSDAPVATEAYDEMSVYTNRATVNASVVKPGAAEYGIRYRVAGSGNWTSVPVVPEGSTYSAVLTGLQPGTAYEYAAYADDFTAPARSFTTEAAAQLPNAGFEDWDTSSNTYLIYAPGGQMFWDSGNRGATTMPGAGSITTPDGDVKHSGNYSAKLYSKFVGLSSIGKFAAGNIFCGKYLGTDGTDGILGWGRAFASRPTAVKVWAKYVPGIAVNKKGGDDAYIPAGQPDKGIVYIALTDGTTDSHNGENWSFVIKTKKSARRLFDKNEERVIAYGEHVFETATSGDGLIEITIPIDYKRTDVRPSNILFVGSASRYGDYFSGGEGSTLWLDDIELIYE